LVPKFRQYVHAAGLQRNLPSASHDDTRAADGEGAHANGIAISEFPTTIAAARRARELGMTVVRGARNLVLGGSHSGNVSAAVLVDEGLLDILTSDYVPSSLRHAACILAQRGMPLHESIAIVTARPADAAGLTDRGRIASCRPADLLRVRLIDGIPVIGNLWVAGRPYL
jgi:alpha-D-ribose 1-methylphosphonate 5-triphosphate diphosphatase